MPRYKDYAPMYQAFDRFIQGSILGDRSILLPERAAWTQENVRVVKERFVDHPEFDSSMSFNEKLRQQMEGATYDQWLVLADVHYVYNLPSVSMKARTKIQQIRRIGEYGGLVLPDDRSELWKPLAIGFVHTGQRFHLRYLQLWLILLFADALKSESDVAGKLQDPKWTQALLDSLLRSIPARADRAYDMRHVILYLMYPDEYEPTINTADKGEIVKSFSKHLSRTFSNDIDTALKQIRDVVSPEYDRDGVPFAYYEAPAALVWNPARVTPPSPQPAGTSPVLKEQEPDKPAELPADAYRVLKQLERTRNVILQGPPGTGKTYIATMAARTLVEPQSMKPLAEAASTQRAVEGLTIYDTAALSMYLEGPERSYTVSELLSHKVIRSRERMFTVKSPHSVLWSALGLHTNLQSETVKVSDRFAPYIFDKTPDSRWYLTDEGKFYVRENLMDRVQMLKAEVKPQDWRDFVEQVTFHQSFAYEDFVEGWRPTQEGDEAELSYKVQPGVLRRIAQRAQADPGNNYVLVIDEINRGNIAKILGELISLLEDDKRIGQPNEMAVTLPYSGIKFGLPSNLYILATMNTADRSIALLDTALRRRFIFVNLFPAPGLLDGVMVTSDVASVDLGKLLRTLNGAIAQHVDRHHQLGHSYFLRVRDMAEEDRIGELEYVWNLQILPLLEEYFYSQTRELRALLQPFAAGEESESRAEIERLYGEDLLQALSALSEQSFPVGE